MLLKKDIVSPDMEICGSCGSGTGRGCCSNCGGSGCRCCCKSGSTGPTGPTEPGLLGKPNIC